MRFPYVGVLCLAVSLWLSAADADTGVDAPRGGVAAYNNAINARDLEQVLSYLVEGANQLNLHQAHSFTAGVEQLSTDLALQWRQISPILFATTQTYTRTVDASEALVDGDLAIVWAGITTRTQPLRSAAVTEMTFTETYILFRLDGAWKIAALANNRPTR